MNTLQEKSRVSEEQDADLATTASGKNELKREAIEITEEARKEYQMPTFGGELFVGKFSSQMLFPYPVQSLEDKREGDQLIEQLMKLLKEELDPEEVDATRTIPKKVIDEMKRMGIFALKIPKEYGGLGLSQTNYCRLVMNVAAYCGSTAVLISAHQSIGVPQPLKMFGSEAQKKKFFPRFRQGAISAFALTEPEVGSDPAQMSTTAHLSDDGSHYILNGEKLWCTNGTIADIIIVMARTPSKIIKGKERKQISAFILEMNTPGIEIVHRCEFMGLGGIYNAYLKFKNVKIPKENILLSEGRGLSLALSTINVGRLTLPAACTGAAKQCLGIVRRWGKSRVQWGMPVGLHEAGRNKVAFIAATTMAMEAITWLTCAWQDQGNLDIRIEAAMAKLFCTEALWKIVDQTMQLRGGRGYEKARSLKARGESPYPVERMMRDCRINLILEGSTEIMKLFLAREAIDPYLKRVAGLLDSRRSFGQKFKTALTTLGYYTKWYSSNWLREQKGNSYKELGMLEKHFQFVEKNGHRLARHIFKAMLKYRQNLERKQMLLGRLVEIGTELFAMSATCSYAIHVKNEELHDNSSIELADYFCLMSQSRVNQLFDALDNNDDRHANEIAQKTLDQSFTWLEKGVQWLE